MQIEFADKTVKVTFDEPDSVNVYDAIEFVTKAMEAKGAELVHPFHPFEQMTDLGQGERKFDDDYIRADIGFLIPGIGNIWIEIECQHD